MNFSLWTFLAFGISVISCSFNKNNFLDCFENEFKTYFDDILLPFLDQHDNLLYLLDYPETLLSELNDLDSIAPNLLVTHCLSHLEQKSLDAEIYKLTEYNWIKTRISSFSKKFEVVYISERQHKLLYPVDIDISNFYKATHKEYKEPSSSTLGSYQETYQLIMRSFDEILERGQTFLINCSLNGCCHLYADLIYFFKTLKASVEQVLCEYEQVEFDSVMLFVVQASKGYLGSRFRDLSELPDSVKIRDGFINEFSGEINAIWINVINKIETFDYDHNFKATGACINDDSHIGKLQPTEMEWKIMADRILTVKKVFQNDYIPQRIADAGSNIIDSISQYCESNFKSRSQSSISQLESHVRDSFKGIFQVFKQNDCFRELINDLDERLCKAFDLSVQDPSVLETEKLQNIYNNHRELVNNVLYQFNAATATLHDSWVNAHFFEDDACSSEIYSFVKELNLKATVSCREMLKDKYPNEKNFVVNLESLLDERLKITNLDQVYLEIFTDFVKYHFREQFFDKFDIFNKLNIVDDQRIETITKEQVLENPLYVTERIEKLEEYYKSEAIDFLNETYSEFIEKEFKGTGSSLKNIISCSIYGVLNN